LYLQKGLRTILAENAKGRAGEPAKLHFGIEICWVLFRISTHGGALAIPLAFHRASGRRSGRKALGVGMKSVRLVVVFVVALLFSASSLFAQGGATGAITGTVQDASGAVVAGAKVKIS
jgi:hypothetical protein